MLRLRPLTIEEIVAEGAERAAHGEKQPVGFGFASIAASPLVRKTSIPAPSPPNDDVAAMLAAAEVRLKRTSPSPQQ